MYPGTKRGLDGLQKDKRSEEEKSIKAVETTKSSEALDQLLYGKHFKKLYSDSAFVETF
ncbi:hypothetical protein ACFSKL_00840 [Belliella marina]|uniref:Uncharacterized protein n=1 Tax=Belliella marina TaxID=1644146 RepID=A0ABW4VIF5_9BACT